MKNNQMFNLGKRDWLILWLTLAVLGTNWLWYQYHQAQEISLDSLVNSSFQHQVKITKLQDCINQGTSPCN